MENRIDIAKLRTLFAFDAETGLITRISAYHPNRTPAGSEAGCLDKKGYRRIKVGDVNLAGHRVAWALHYGEWPEGMLDHTNGVRDDNRIANLRVATYTDNARNAAMPTTNTSGFKGVTWNKAVNKWMAAIKVDGRSKTLGYFADPAVAHDAYRAAKLKFHGEFAR